MRNATETRATAAARAGLRVFAAAVTVMLLICLVPQGPAHAREDSHSEVLLPHILVIGTRRHVHSIKDTPSPVEVIPGEDLTDQGTGDISNLIRTMVPSYNVSTQPISDAATFVRPPNLRGLSSDQTLVFINGKRRHRAAVISFLGNGISDASQGPDISVIPAIALKRVEVLRDSASAQYGSDAIAGVINFVLKDSPEGGTVEMQWGQTYEGDGEEYRTAFNIGVPVTESGFANLSAEWREAGPTVRSVQRDDAAGLVAGGNPHVRQPYAQVWGQPDVSDDIKVFLNSGLEITEGLEFYAFGNLARREAEGGFFFRNPNERSGVFVNKVDHDSNPDTEKVFYRLADGADCPAEAERVVADKNEFFRGYPGDCFTFNKSFPGGFTPQFSGKVSDRAGTLGFRGSLDSGLTYDTSYTVGRSEVDFFIRDTVNASLGAESPTRFELGSYVQTEHTLNLDLARPFQVPALASPLYVAAGGEWRREEFRVRPGERSSWEAGRLAEADFGIGANGFSGFSDSVSGKWDRSNIAAYLDVEADILPRLTLQTMGRWENFDDFGSTADGKVAALFRVLPGLGLRGSAGTGFRVPTVGQQNIHNVTTAFLDGELRQKGTIPPTCPEAVRAGAKPLEPEESLTFSVGLMAESGPVVLTADYFNIRVDDRLGQSKDITLNERVEGSCLQAADVLRFSYFGNSFDTRTQGVDVIATIEVSRMPFFPGSGKTELVFSGNWTDTQVVEYDPVFLDEQRILQLEKALPDYRFNATLRHERNAISGFLRLNYFGSYTETHADQLDKLIHAGDEVTLDVEVSYVFAKRVELSLGAENIFNNFPDKNPYSGFVGAKYPESSPMGFAGGFYYGRIRYLL